MPPKWDIFSPNFVFLEENFLTKRQLSESPKLREGGGQLPSCHDAADFCQLHRVQLWLILCLPAWPGMERFGHDATHKFINVIIGVVTRTSPERHLSLRCQKIGLSFNVQKNDTKIIPAHILSLSQLKIRIIFYTVCIKYDLVLAV